MLRSMTGYGSGEHSDARWCVHVEIRSVNQRFLDIQVRAPRWFLRIEDRVRKAVEQAVSRGRVTVYLEWRSDQPQGAPVLDKEAARAFVEELRALKKELDLSGDVDVTLLAGARESLGTFSELPGAEEAWSLVGPALSSALSELVRMRENEGEELARDVAHRLDVIERILGSIEDEAGKAAESAKDRLVERVEKLMCEQVPVDENRLAQEIAIAAERADFTEECVRLKSHTGQVRQCLDSDQPVGKRLNFLAQEMHREANTIGSKNEDVEVAGAVVTLKEEIEKVREQVQNVE